MFSYLEYQLVTLGFALCMIASLGTLEIFMRKYQILPLLYNGMFTSRNRRLYCFGTDITSGAGGKMIRRRSKMMVRIYRSRNIFVRPSPGRPLRSSVAY